MIAFCLAAAVLAVVACVCVKAYDRHRLVRSYYDIMRDGDPVVQLYDALGKPDNAVSAFGMRTLYYDTAMGRFSFDLDMSGNKIRGKAFLGNSLNRLVCGA